MNILIVGEYSGVARNLAIGFSKLEIQTDVITDGDGYKNVSNRSVNAITSSLFWRWSSQIFKAILCLNKKYDHVIFLSPFVFKFPLSLNRKLYQSLIDRSSNAILLSCTSDSVWWRDYDPTRGRSPHLGSLKDTGGIAHRYANEKHYMSNLSLLKIINRVIALAPEYKYSYDAHCDKVDWIPFPFQQTMEKSGSCHRNLAYHGITRRGFKGSEKLLTMLEGFRSTGLETLITEKIPYNKFVQNLLRSTVYLDQAYSHVPAMSALAALELVPYVLTGIQPNSLNERYFYDCPAIDVFEDTDKLYTLVSDHSMHYDRLDRNREFLSKYHDPETICKQILK